MARPVKRQAPQAAPAADDIDEKHLLAFIVKDKYKEVQQCKQELEKYCKELEEIDKDLGKVDKKVKEICDKTKRDEKCKNLKDEVEQELDAFDIDLQDEKVCEKYEEKCILLEETDYDDIKSDCVNLREKCYKLKREKVAEELLLRALGGDAKEEAKCKGKMNTVCPVLSRESDELMSFCLDPTGTCGDLKTKLGEVCKPLETELNEKSSEKCHERLEKCHFYKEACTETKCDEDMKQCKEKGFTYKAPESDFSPVKPKASLLRSIGFDDVYKRAEKEGIIIGKSGVDLPRKSGTKFLQDLLLVLSRDGNEKEPDKKCKKALEKCDASKYLNTELKKLCEDQKKDDKCKELLDVNVKERCTNLKLKLYLKGLSTGYEKADSDLLLWGQLPTFFIKGECAELESECFYLENACKDNNIDKACQNARAACYKKGQDRMLNKFFQKELRGKLGLVRFYSDPEECKKSVVGNCTKLKGDKRYFSKCLYPKELCYAVSNDIFLQSKELSLLLDDQRDFPFEKDCLELGEKCDQLSSDSLLNLEKCITLKRRCEYFRVSEGFRKVFLEKKDDSLMTQGNCTKALHGKCHQLYRRRKNSFSVSCALPEETCSYMVFHTSQDCKYLKENIKNGEIVGKIEKANGNEATLEELCTTWGRHCHQLVENCPDQLKKENGNGNNHNCEALDEKCRDTFEKLKAKDELTHLLKGSLSKDDDCKKKLGESCTELEKNEAFKTLYSKCDDKIAEELCKKLVKKVKERCPTLKTDLNKAKEELTKMKKEYDELKQVAEKSTEAAKLLLSKSGKAAMPSGQDSNGSAPVSAPAGSGSPSSPAVPPPPGSPQNGTTDASGKTPSTGDGTPGTPGSGTPNYVKFGLVKRAYVDGGVSEVEVKAFDATTIALELYLELKEECSALQLDCGFKEDCKETEPACKEIDTLCGGIKPLEIKPHHTETQKEISTTTTTTTTTTTMTSTTTTTTTTTTTKPGSGGKVTEECTMIQTTDTWVTSTSLHTSTITSTSTVTSTVTLTSMRKCKPTKCTTDSSKETQKEEEEEVKPNDGVKIRVPDMIKIMLLGVIVMGMM
ncbi:hypothetical protein T552_03420 [Pneumocystis carinii B80]|uniref:Major surface glycoprotein 2 C-terminal domain-containing protein n=2 Tax=Pneumocystis carinii TaxID=4754 RepID=A0A0W4ZAS6_PNEC8|nr:hypothetical protein T552_03420 [Pneumocystis carinii B80]KTW25560.1 hypothetical protein T552_03420 [Pneumocystis carinii B80]CAC43461.1 probable major surface glycoprotein [Pneumocystis carinii]